MVIGGNSMIIDIEGHSKVFMHFLGMSRALLESVRIPCSKSSTKEWYNVVLLEKLLHILFSACQYGMKSYF